MTPIDPIDPQTVYPWAPTPDDVARVSPNYTEGGFDDEVSPDTAPGMFTDTTEPTANEVQGLILIACNEVQGRVGVTPMPERCYTLASTTATWHVAAGIAADKGQAGSDDARSEYTSKILNYRNSLDELVSQARMALGTRLH